MKLEIDLSKLINARHSMGAEEISLDVTKPELSPLESQLKESGKVVLQGKELFKELKFPYGLTAIGNTPVTVHIYEPRPLWKWKKKDEAPEPRFHVFECEKIKEMIAKKEFSKRYVSTSHEDETDATFSISPWNPESERNEGEEEKKLKICRYCLDGLHYDGYSKDLSKREKKEIVENFDLFKFWAEHKPMFWTLPSPTADDYPRDYPSNWAEKSRQLRRDKGWKCECCSVLLKAKKELLHSHHKDRDHYNCEPSNLASLCIICHKARHRDFSAMRIANEDKEAIRKARTDQRLDIICSNCDS